MPRGSQIPLLAPLALAAGCLVNTDLYEQRQAEILAAQQAGGGWGVRFAGRPDCIDIDMGGLTLDGAWTLEMYLLASQGGPGTAFPLAVWPGVFALLQNEDGYTLAAPASNPVTTAGASATRSIMDGSYHHIALNYGAGSELSLYLDGVLGSHAPVALDADPEPRMHLGCWTEEGLTFDGVIAEVRLSAAALYADDFTPAWEPYEVEQATLGLWHIDEGQGSRIADETDSFPGILIGGVWERFSLTRE
jgi:hypothetical protein